MDEERTTAQGGKNLGKGKLYYPRYNSYLIEKVLSVCGLLFFVCYLLVKFTSGNRDWAGVCLGFCLSAWSVPVVLFCFKLREGYTIQKDGVYFRYRFLKNKLLYQDIKCIIISNSNGNTRITKTPYVTIIGGEADGVLQYCLSGERSHVLTANGIRYKLGAEIGCYHPGNILEMFHKGSSIIHDYGFVWNKREMYKLLQGFMGDWYVAASVMENYQNEFDELVKEFQIAGERIHVIDDTANIDIV